MVRQFRTRCADLGQDALLSPWQSSGGSVWCNPPYSRIRPWLEQALRASRLVPVVMLIPSDTSTRWCAPPRYSYMEARA